MFQNFACGMSYTEYFLPQILVFFFKCYYGTILLYNICIFDRWESYNKLYGRTSNPYNTTRIVGGSSGGEGCIQAAAGSCFGIGKI